MNMELPDRVEAAKAAEAAPGFVIVTQVKSNRVVYFTNDPDYSPPMDGDWYYISHYLGELPADLSLRNCWRWRFNGGVFSDTKPKGAPVAPKISLLEHNRKALLEILNEKIDGVRAQYAPSCIMGVMVREQKLREAEQYLAGSSECELPLLEAAAVARNISMFDAAHLVKDRAALTANALAETERIRERFALAIAESKAEADLLSLRESLLDEVYPRMTEKFAYKLAKTEQVDPDKLLGATHLRHEQTRLRVQLREAINARRALWTSQYSLDDVISRHKGMLAERLFANKGQKVEGIDFSVLEAHAQARGVTLAEAARDVLKELSEMGSMLAETEKTKDAMLGEVAAAKTLSQLRRVSVKIGGM